LALLFDRPLKLAREAWLAPFERAYARALLDRHAGNITAAARAAGVDRITFYRLLDRHGLR
jgi:transcriptional regulator of acetoin/glycerol metabolism